MSASRVKSSKQESNKKEKHKDKDFFIGFFLTTYFYLLGQKHNDRSVLEEECDDFLYKKCKKKKNRQNHNVNH